MSMLRWVNIYNNRLTCPWETLLLEENMLSYHQITVLPKLLEKRLTQCVGIMHLTPLLGLLLQVECNVRNSVGELLSILYQTKLPYIWYRCQWQQQHDNLYRFITPLCTILQKLQPQVNCGNPNNVLSSNPQFFRINWVEPSNIFENIKHVGFMRPIHQNTLQGFT